jgi:glycosyltransferase involved in cell wall biosynthesis
MLGFDLSPYLLVEKSNKNILKSKLGFNTESVIVTIVGRLVPIKNHKLYIDIICELKTIIKNLVGLIVGDGEEMIPLQKYCLNKGLSFSISATDNQFDVKFLSWRKDLPDIYSITDFVLLTSINEGTPVSIIEAMASGCIVLSTDVGGVSDVIEYECGFVCDSNVSSFVKDIVKVYFDSSLKSKISQNARNAVKEKYSYNKLCSNIELEYDELINNKI